VMAPPQVPAGCVRADETGSPRYDRLQRCGPLFSIVRGLVSMGHLCQFPTYRTHGNGNRSVALRVVSWREALSAESSVITAKLQPSLSAPTKAANNAFNSKLA
jgi:hypothetical protein